MMHCRLSPNTPRFGAWNSDPKRLTPASGWDNPPVRFETLELAEFNTPLEKMSPEKQREKRHFAATHEAGHFLMFIALGYSEDIFQVQIKPKAAGVHYSTPNSATYRFNSLLISRAGDMLTALLKGYPSYWHTDEATRKQAGLTSDYTDMCHDVNTSLKILRKEPRLAWRHHAWDKLYELQNNLDTLTQAHLQQYPRTVVEALACQLMREERWNRGRIRELIHAVDLENVPSLTQHTVPEENQVPLSFRTQLRFRLSA